MSQPIYKTVSFIATPMPGAKEVDLTRATITVDLVNSLGETYHFEVSPNDDKKLPDRSTDAPITGNVVLNALFEFIKV